MAKEHEQVFRKLFDKYYNAIVSYFRQNGFPEENARDLAQETFLRVYRGIKRYRAESEWTYLKTIAKHVMLNEIRHWESRIEDPKQDPVPIDNAPFGNSPLTRRKPDDPEEAAMKRERLQILRQAVGRLPRRMRICLTLHHQGFKYHEIAVIMKTTMDSVKKCLYQARKKLKQEIGRTSKGESPE